MTLPATMRAALLDHPGGALRLAEIPRPEPGPGQVLIRIETSGVNPLDTKIRAGAAAHARHPLPAILGIDMAGTVAALGAGVTGFRPGEAVYGMTGGVGGHQGSLAEYAAVDAALLAPAPTALGPRAAAALPLAFITAWEGLVDRARVSEGQMVLVQGGGGVGQAVIQLARAFGARVFATDAPPRRATIERLGAGFIDHRSETAADYVARLTDGRGFDIVYDTVGGVALDASFAAVRRFGHVVSSLGWGSHALAPLSFRAATYSGVFTLLPLLTGEGRAQHGAILREATRLAEAGHLTVELDPRRFTLATANEAHAAILDGSARGKIVVEIAEPGAPA